MSCALHTEDLAIGYGSRRSCCTVLEHLNLSVAPGELVCLLGPNGAGKSTLLRTISKIQPALSGTIEIGGTPLPRLSQMELARRLGVVLTERVSIGSLSAQRIVELGRYPHLGWSGKLGRRDDEVVSWALAAVGAERLAARDSATLSDGERQRIMVARALAQEPLILLLDEPTAFLDVPSRVELMGLLKELARQEQLAVIVSTHHLELALRMADTVWLIERSGELHAGAPEDVIAAGRVAGAFQSDTIRFHAEECAFRLRGGSRGRAAVRGEGLSAALARAVLEREGYAIAAQGEEALTVTLAASRSFAWSAAAGDRSGSGDTFAELADFIRRIPREMHGDSACVPNRQRHEQLNVRSTSHVHERF